MEPTNERSQFPDWRTLRGFRMLCAALLFAVLLLASTSVSDARTLQSGGTDAGIAGTWRGTLGSGAAQLHIELTINRLGSGEYGGQLNSVDQGAVIPMDSLAVQDGKVRF